MQKNENSAIVSISENFEEKVKNGKGEIFFYFSPSEGYKNDILISLMEESARKIEEKVFGERKIKISSNSVSKSQNSVGYVANLLPGLIGMVIFSISIFSIAMPITASREKGYLKRLCVSPVPRSIYLASFLTTGAIVSVIQTLVLVFTSIVCYDIKASGSFLDISLLTLIAICSFMSLGLFIASISPTSVTANILGFSIFFPMLFLSEVYFPISNLPDILKNIVSLFPLIHFVTVFRKIMNEGMALQFFSKEVGILLFWAIVPAILSWKFFYWTPKKNSR